MRKLIYLMSVISMSGYAQSPKLKEQLVQFELFFKKGESELVEEHLTTLGINADKMYNSTFIHVQAYYSTYGNIQKNESVAFAKLENIKNYLLEERVDSKIILLEALPQRKSYDVVVSFAYPETHKISAIMRSVDTVIVHPDGFRVEVNTDNITSILNSRVIKRSISDGFGQTTISSSGDALACAGIYEIQFQANSLYDTAHILLPVEEGMEKTKLFVYTLNKYTGEWNKSNFQVKQKKIAKKKFISVPVSESGVISLQYSIQKTGIPVSLKMPDDIGVVSGSIYAQYPDMIQPGKISKKQNEISFIFTPQARLTKIDLQLESINSEQYVIDQNKLIEELTKKIKNKTSDDIIRFDLKSEYLLSVKDSVSK